MKLMIIKTETADLLQNVDKNVSVLAKIAYFFYNEEEKKVFFEEEYVKPDVPMTPKASAVNGITDIDVGLEPDEDGTIKQVPHPKDSKAIKRMLAGILKYKDDKDFYLVGYNTENFDFKVLERALGTEGVFDNVKKIDLYRIMKYLCYTDRGRALVKSGLGDNFLAPESISLQYLKYFFKLYKGRKEVRDFIAESVQNSENGTEIDDIIDILVLFEFVKERVFEGNIKRMEEISNNFIKLDYIPYGYLKNQKIDDIDTNKLLNFIQKVDNDEDLYQTIKENLKEREVDDSLLRKI